MNYYDLFMQLLPEAVLVITALVLLGAAVAVEAKTGQAISSGMTGALAALGILLAVAALFCPAHQPLKGGRFDFP